MTGPVLAPARERLHDLMLATLADEAARHDWTYRAVRPLQTPARPWHAGMAVTGDCSKGVQWLCWWASAPDPMNNQWASIGNSSTLAAELHHLNTPGELEVGDIVTIGVNGSEHAAMVLLAGPDPVLWSFGHEGAPNSYRLSADSRRPKQYLRLPVADLPPTPQEKLRERTGYWAWLKWRLGREEWKRYGARNKTVRPHVPLLIPPGWWKAYITFVRDESKGNP